METLKLPTDRITVAPDGAVIGIRHWVLWNNQPSITIEINRLPSGEYISNIGDPEHGGGQRIGTLEEVLGGLHPEVSAKYTALFSLSNPTEADLKTIGFEDYEIRRH